MTNEEHEKEYGWCPKPTASKTAEMLDTWLYSTLCGYRKEHGWSLKSTSGTIKKRNFIRCIGIKDSESSWVDVKYVGLNIESFNTLSLESEKFSVSLRVKKDSALHNFVVDFFNHFCYKGGVV